MLFVFNKEKISSYLVLLSTVIILFSLAFNISEKDTIETKAKQIDGTNNEILNIVGD